MDGSAIEGYNVSVFPNPAQDVLNVALASEDDFEVEIMNTLGEILIKTKNQNAIDVSDLQSGVYLVKVLNAKYLVTEKFIKK